MQGKNIFVQHLFICLLFDFANQQTILQVNPIFLGRNQGYYPGRNRQFQIYFDKDQKKSSVIWFVQFIN